MASVTFAGVTKRFGSVTALDAVDLTIDDGQFCVLLGPSGCGKSTLLRVLAGLERATAGSVSIGATVVDDVAPAERDIAMVFQSYALYPHRTARQNIELPLRTRKVASDERARIVTEVAGQLDLVDVLDRKPGQMSGGQRQRVALARAIVRRPAVFCMDEPLSNLDAQLRAQTRAELISLHQRLATTVVYVTHDQVEAMTMGEKVAVMRAGRIEQVGTPQDVYDRPATAFVARFLGSPPMNLLPAGSVEAGAIVGIRPEHLAVGEPEGSIISGRVRLVESLGHERLVLVRPDSVMATVDVVMRFAPDAPTPAPGTPVHLHAVGPVHRFDPATEARR